MEWLGSLMRGGRQLRFLLAAVLVCAVLGAAGRQHFVIAYEDLAFKIDPSAERAYAYGSKSFDAVLSERYNVTRAESFFTKALALDPSMPLVRHELARIAFLRSEFAKALFLIDEEITLNAEPSPSSYYARALIKGYSGDFLGAARDYETFFSITPANWGSINDYAWVLLKADVPEGALAALEWGLEEWPENPWLLNSASIAYYETGQLGAALEAARRAANRIHTVTKEDWLFAYPGNDPLIADEGLAAFRQAVITNQKVIEDAFAKSLSEPR